MCTLAKLSHHHVQLVLIPKVYVTEFWKTVDIRTTVLL